MIVRARKNHIVRHFLGEWSRRVQSRCDLPDRAGRYFCETCQLLISGRHPTEKLTRFMKHCLVGVHRVVWDCFLHRFEVCQ